MSYVSSSFSSLSKRKLGFPSLREITNPLTSTLFLVSGYFLWIFLSETKMMNGLKFKTRLRNDNVAVLHTHDVTESISTFARRRKRFNIEPLMENSLNHGLKGSNPPPPPPQKKVIYMVYSTKGLSQPRITWILSPLPARHPSRAPPHTPPWLATRLGFHLHIT